MAGSSLRAARSERRGGLPNALFVVAAAESPPAELRGVADVLMILFPWGSLLRGALALDRQAAAGIAAPLRPGGRLSAFVSITDRDAAAAGVPPLSDDDEDGIARRWSAHGLDLVSFEPASGEDVVATGSSWARRLRAAADRPVADRAVWRLELIAREAGPPLTAQRSPAIVAT